jgi:spore coat-associated protein N
MSRFKSLKANPRRSLAALATVLIAVGVTGASGANFTATSANPANTFTAGTMTILNQKEGAAVFTSSPNMRPGDTVTGTVKIKNTGSLSGAFKLAKGPLTDNHATIHMSDKLDFVVSDCGTDLDCVTKSNVYTGTLAAMGTNYALGNFTANEEHLYEFTATFNAGANDTYQSKSSTVEFDWSAS